MRALPGSSFSGGAVLLNLKLRVKRMVSYILMSLFINLNKPPEINPWPKCIRELGFEVLMKVAIKVTASWDIT
jgi:hypothetical protein